MNPLYSWIDSTAVRQLAEELLQPIDLEKNEQPSLDSNPQDSSNTAPEPTPETQPEPPPSSPFPERALILRNWLKENFQAYKTFILDPNGNVLFDDCKEAQLHFMARNLAVVARETGHIHVKIGPAAIMQIVSCETEQGRLILGMVIPELIPSEHVKIITEVLIQSASFH